MTDRRLNLQANLDRLYDQLAGKEKAWVTAPQEDKVRLQQQIADLKEEIAQFEAELSGLAAPEASDRRSPDLGSGSQGQLGLSQLRRDRLERQREQLLKEHGAVLAQWGMALSSVDQMRLEQQLQDCEERIAAIDQQLNEVSNPISQPPAQPPTMLQHNDDQAKGIQVTVTGGSPIIGEVHYHSAPPTLDSEK